MRKRNLKQTALAILVLAVCLFSPACNEDPHSPTFFADNVLLSCFLGLTYGTVEVPYYEYNHGDPIKVGPPAFALRQEPRPQSFAHSTSRTLSPIAF
jgi:hypothetical protein